MAAEITKLGSRMAAQRKPSPPGGGPASAGGGSGGAAAGAAASSTGGPGNGGGGVGGAPGAGAGPAAAAASSSSSSTSWCLRSLSGIVASFLIKRLQLTVNRLHICFRVGGWAASLSTSGSVMPGFCWVSGLVSYLAG